MSAIGIDTSVAVPLLSANHPDHDVVAEWSAGRRLALSGHALAETYSVLTRLPGSLRGDPVTVAGILVKRFERPLLLGAEAFTGLVDRLSAVGIAGGAVYDALVGLAAIDNDAELATRDARARPTYDALGVRVRVVG